MVGNLLDTIINMTSLGWKLIDQQNLMIDVISTFTIMHTHLQKTGNIDPRVNKKHIYIPCSCTKCLNHIEHKVEEVQYYLYRHRIDISYTKWTKHGEEDEPSISAPKPVNATTEFVDDMDFAYIPIDGPTTVEMVNATKDNFDVDDLFQELLLDAEKPLYEGCPDFTKLSAIVKLLNLNGYNGLYLVNETAQMTGDGQQKKASAPVFYGPLTQGLLDAYGCDTIEEYLEWNYFPSTDNESTNIETIDKGNTDKDCIDDSNSAMSKENLKLYPSRLDLLPTFDMYQDQQCSYTLHHLESLLTSSLDILDTLKKILYIIVYRNLCLIRSFHILESWLIECLNIVSMSMGGNNSTSAE
ncbi:retrovirus-related pol polyprotein from transposon TNT 1-94 [Tanacetum coccineum]